MAKKKAPNPYADFVKVFDPANVSKAFDPAAIMEQFGLKAGAFDPEESQVPIRGHVKGQRSRCAILSRVD